MSRDLDWTPRVGQRVVCVDDNFVGGYGFERDPILWQVYTIREITWNEFYQVVQLRFHEIVNKPACYIGGVYEASFSAYRFRPLEEHHTGMEVLREILRTADQRIEEEV